MSGACPESYQDQGLNGEQTTNTSLLHGDVLIPILTSPNFDTTLITVQDRLQAQKMPKHTFATHARGIMPRVSQRISILKMVGA